MPNNFIPPASPLNAAWLVKNMIAEIKTISNAINNVGQNFRKKIELLNKRESLSSKIDFYKTYYNPAIFKHHYDIIKNI